MASDYAYNPDEITLTYGNTRISGFADGTFLEIDPPPNDDFTEVVGADGDVAVSRSNDRRREIRITLLQTSESNKYLSDLRNASLAATGLAGAAPLYVRDRNGRSLHTADTVYIAAPPTVVYARGAESYAWRLKATRMRDDVIGGGNKL